MCGGILIHPVLLFVDHSVAAWDLPGRPRLVQGAGQGSVAKGFGPVPSLFRIPMVNDDLDRHGTAPNTASAFRGISRRCQAPMSPCTINRQRRGHSVTRWSGT